MNKIFKFDNPYFAVIRADSKQHAIDLYKYNISELDNTTIVEEISQIALDKLFANIGEQEKVKRMGIILLDSSLN